MKTTKIIFCIIFIFVGIAIIWSLLGLFIGIITKPSTEYEFEIDGITYLTNHITTNSQNLTITLHNYWKLRIPLYGWEHYQEDKTLSMYELIR